ncbi:hypothetical protein BDV93DRAFT_511511 [Ceratobasidium sp. AG-I]|nr:hypothetical protein BDV93DRAFT_511511 [Ceratobasidium sp. AG-I]
MATYHLARPDQHADQVKWLEALETWRQRSGIPYEWVETRNGEIWEAEVRVNGQLVPGVLGVGMKKQDAKEDAAKQLDAVGVLNELRDTNNFSYVLTWIRC